MRWQSMGGQHSSYACAAWATHQVHHIIHSLAGTKQSCYHATREPTQSSTRTQLPPKAPQRQPMDGPQARDRLR